jgi:Glyoxalase-like domain
MLQLDHLTVIAPSLAEGVDHVRHCLGIDMPYGRAHPYMGTRNHLLRLGEDVYLEVIAIDPHATPPARPRWFGLDDQRAVRAAWDNGLRLRAWVARTADIDAVLPLHEAVVGRKTRFTVGDASFHFSLTPDGALARQGIAPAVIDRGQRPLPPSTLPDFGARLQRFTVAHPQPAQVTALYELLRINNAPTVRKGPVLRYHAEIQTPAGVKELY